LSADTLDNAETLDNTATTPEYQPVSRLAVAGFALAVASLVVFVAPPISVVVPIAAAIVSILALVGLRRNRELAGSGLARIGLALALFALAAGSTYWLLREWQLRRAAEQVAERFVQALLDGDVRAAHQMTLPPKLRFATDRPLEDSYRDHAAARDALAKFSEDALVKELLGREAKITRTAALWHESHRGAEGFGVTVESWEDPSESAPEFGVELLVEQITGESNAGWIVSRYSSNGKFVTRSGKTTLENR
jgi:hypothetical protein